MDSSFCQKTRLLTMSSSPILPTPLVLLPETILSASIRCVGARRTHFQPRRVYMAPPYLDHRTTRHGSRNFSRVAVQSALETIEKESKKAGETHTTARFSLQLEVDRLKRDLERLEDDLARARKDVDDRDTKNRDREGALDKLHAENRDLASQLAAQTQARLNMGEKLDGVQSSLRSAESELAVFKMRVADLEQRLSKDQRSLLTAESQYRDQLTERNTLLLTIYQYMDKILGVDKTPVSPPVYL